MNRNKLTCNDRRTSCMGGRHPRAPSARASIAGATLAASVALTASLSMLATSNALAQAAPDYPSRPIRVIVPVVPGGALDNVARLLGQKMSERLGQPVVVENKPGAAGVIGMDAVAKATPDGYTLLFAAAPIAMNTALGMKLPYDPIKSFAPITLAASIPILFAVHPSTPYKTMADVVADSKRRPDGVAYAIANIGATPHLIGEAWKAATKANLTMVAYKGAGQAIQDAVGGTVPMILDAYIPTGTQVAAGKLRAIAIASAKRSPLLPDVQTVGEQGHPELVGSGFYGLLAPAGTPAAIVTKLNAAAVAGLGEPEVSERLLKQGYEVHASTPQGYADFIRNEIERWTPVVKAAGIKRE